MAMRELEDKIMRAATSVLEARAPGLERVGFTYSAPEIEVWASASETYTSEIRVTILRGGNIEHVLETHIYRDGQALVTVEEAQQWFDEHLGKMVATSK